VTEFYSATDLEQAGYASHRLTELWNTRCGPGSVGDLHRIRAGLRHPSGDNRRRSEGGVAADGTDACAREPARADMRGRCLVCLVAPGGLRMISGFCAADLGVLARRSSDGDNPNLADRRRRCAGGSADTPPLAGALGSPAGRCRGRAGRRVDRPGAHRCPGPRAPHTAVLARRQTAVSRRLSKGAGLLHGWCPRVSRLSRAVSVVPPLRSVELLWKSARDDRTDVRAGGQWSQRGAAITSRRCWRCGRATQ